MICSEFVYREKEISACHLDTRAFEDAKKEIFDEKEYEFKSEGVSEEPFIIDCGSNIGLSILYFKSEYPKSRVLGFEPVPENFAILGENMKRNGLNRVEIKQAALAGKEGEISLFGSGLAASISRAWGVQVAEEHRIVTSVQLSKHIDREVDYLKLDIEGAEEIVIPEIKDKLPLVKEIYIEYHETQGRSFLDKILTILDGYYHRVETESKDLERYLPRDRLEWKKRENAIMKTIRAYNRVTAH
jgi:FkbM family methyltransferase